MIALLIAGYALGVAVTWAAVLHAVVYCGGHDFSGDRVYVVAQSALSFLLAVMWPLWAPFAALGYGYVRVLKAVRA